MSHALFKASLFMGAGALLHTVGSRFLFDMGGMRRHMKKTYIFMMLSGLSLAGAPLITSGFWSKDAIFASLIESGYTFSWQLFGVAVVVAIMTAFYTFRMMGMAFFGKESRHLEDMQNEGHHLHEVGKSMWIPFGALAVATISIGLIGFIFEEQLHHFLGEYLADSFGIAEEPDGSESVARVEDQESTSFLGLNSAALMGSVGAFGVGGALGYVFYIA